MQSTENTKTSANAPTMRLDIDALVTRLELLDRNGGLGYGAHALIKDAARSLAAERDRADRAEARLAESWYDGFDAGSRPPHQKTRQNPHVTSEATA